MDKYELKETQEFEKQFSKLPEHIKHRFEKQFRKVEENPYTIGKPLGYDWFRELKNMIYRVYYLIYKKDIIVLFVGVSDKKNQQESVDLIKENFKLFKEVVENMKNR